jgi:hypothetical protein
MFVSSGGSRSLIAGREETPLSEVMQFYPGKLEQAITTICCTLTGTPGISA